METDNHIGSAAVRQFANPIDGKPRRLFLWLSGKAPSEPLLPSLAALFSRGAQHAEASGGARLRDKSEIL